MTAKQIEQAVSKATHGYEDKHCSYQQFPFDFGILGIQFKRLRGQTAPRWSLRHPTLSFGYDANPKNRPTPMAILTVMEAALHEIAHDTDIIQVHLTWSFDQYQPKGETNMVLTAEVVDYAS